MDARKEEDRNEQELVDAVKPLLIQAEKILNETQGMIKGADPENKVSNRAKRHTLDHRPTPEEQRLAEALKVVSTLATSSDDNSHSSGIQMVEEVGGTIEWARNKLDSFPKAKKDLGPLLDALGRRSIQDHLHFSHV